MTKDEYKQQFSFVRENKEHKEYVHYSSNQRQQARDTDMIEFLRYYEGFTFTRAGSGWRCDQHNSLVINKNRKMWYWNSTQENGITAVDYLQTIHGKTYLEAMDILVGKNRAEIPVAPKLLPEQEKKEELKLPEKNKGQFRELYAYLLQSRKLDQELVNYCVTHNLIYQDERNNAVFVGYDDENKARFASVRGTRKQVLIGSFNITNNNRSNYLFDTKITGDLNKTEIIIDNKNCYRYGPFEMVSNKELYANSFTAECNCVLKPINSKITSLKAPDDNMYDFKKNQQFYLYSSQDTKDISLSVSTIKYRGDCENSDKTYPFKIDGSSPERLYVFEAPIDLLSYISISKKNDPNQSWKNHNFISLSGTSDVALENYLERNKNITSIIFCLDNDEAGNKASEDYIKKYSEKGYRALRKAPKGKDFNDDLVKYLPQKQKEGEAVLVQAQSLSR